jgi:hypothetical protein
MMISRRWQVIFTAAISAVLFLSFSNSTFAFSDWSDCEDCHDGFTENPYISKQDGSNWGDDLMDAHTAFVGGNCNACHKSGSKGEVFLNFSVDGSLSKSCVGCHGRDEDVTGSCTGLAGSLGGMEVECGSGSGLRQNHELKVGAGTCNSCHTGDATPVGEHVAPFNYGRTGVVMQDSCDGDGTESQFGASGLNNDGDATRDGGDSDCQSNTAPTQPGTLAASAITTSSATVSWGASTDADGDTITYRVDYRRNGDTPWTDGGSTTGTSRPLSGLDAAQFYDVRITPNDGSTDGPNRTTLNLFQTDAGNSAPTQPGTLAASAITTSSATVSWGASTDADGDTITYQVDYRRNGDTPWTDGGSTTGTLRPLSGLDAAQFYDIRITPNDGTVDGPNRSQLNLFQTESDSLLTCLEMGALAYDNWTKTDAGGTGALPSGAVDSDYVRCKACHGWDHTGTDGGYVRRSRNAGRPNAGAGDADQTSRNISLVARMGADVTTDMIWHAGTGRSFFDGAGSWVALDDTPSAANTAAHSFGYTLGNQHPDFTAGGVSGLSQEQADCLAVFLNSPEADPAAYFNAIYPGQNPALYDIIGDADAGRGVIFYNNNCMGCHGDPAVDHQGTNGGVPEGGILAYLAQDGKFSEFSHKARWGIPNTIMSRSSIGNPASSDIADVMLYLQEQDGTGFAITAGISGTWWNALRDGEGWLIDASKNAFVATFYTYDSLGNQAWVVGEGVSAGNSVTVELEFAEGAMYGSGFNSDDVSRSDWGQAVFTFTSCTKGVVELIPNTTFIALGFEAMTIELGRLTASAIPCPY